MNRAPYDNALLASCDRFYGRAARVCAAVLVYVGIGVVWYLCVAIPAGAL